MGENFQKKQAASFKHHGDQALREFRAANLWSNRPDIAAKDYVCHPTSDAIALPGTDVLLECEEKACVRVIAGVRELGVLVNAAELADALHERGGVGKATIKECSIFGEFTVRVKEEDPDAA